MVKTDSITTQEELLAHFKEGTCKEKELLLLHFSHWTELNAYDFQNDEIVWHNIAKKIIREDTIHHSITILMVLAQ